MADSSQSTHSNIVVIPLNYAGEVLLLREGAGLALPVAPVAAGEDPELVARRALGRATGFKAEAVFSLGELASGVHLFLARNLEPARSMIDAIYQGATERIAWDDLDALADSGRVRDALVIEALFAAREQIAGNAPTDQEGAGDG